MNEQTPITMESLQRRVVTLELEIQQLKQVLRLLNTNLKDLISQPSKPDEVYERYTQGLKENRSVATPSEVVAIFAHYNIRKNLPTKTIARTGLLSMGKAYGIASWDLQFLHDFLEVNKLMEVYENASEMQALAKKYPAIVKLNELV